MQILRNIQKQAPLSPAMQTFFIHFPQFQLLYLFLVIQKITFYHDILDIINIESTTVMKILVIGQVCARSSILTVLSLRYFGFVEKKNKIETLVLKFLKIKIKVLIVCSLNWNTIAYKYCDTFYAGVALFNLLGTVGELLVTRILNSSYRFEQQNLVCQKNTSILSSMMLFPIIYLLDYYELVYASCLILIRCLIQIYFNFNNVENRAIQYCDYFSPLVMMSFCLIEIFSYISGNNFLKSQNTIFFFIIFAGTLYSSHCLTETLMVIVPKYHLKKCPYFIKNEDQQSFAEKEGANSLNEDEEEDFIVALRVLAKVFVTKQKAEGTFFMKENPYHPSPLNQEEFDTWWPEFNQVVINHRVYCTNVACPCMKLTTNARQNSKKVQEIFLEIIFRALQKVIHQRNSTKLSIIEKYFYIELLRKPIKNYYQLIKLKGQIKRSEQILEVEALMQETRQMIGHLLTDEKAQNQQLQITSLLDFQDSLIKIKLQFIQLSTNYQKFYELFSSLIVEIPLLRKITSDLITIKKSVHEQLDVLMVNFSKNLEFLSCCLIFYKYFEEYSDKLTKIQSSINAYNEINQTQLGVRLVQASNKKRTDVFDPIYGAIKIDLVFRPGEVLSATKNICSLLGFKKDEVEGQNVNKIMPYVFARYHDKYLRNFIEKGSIGMLRNKEKIFYARNAEKFILPITVRLKLEYLSSEGFFASSLIKKTPTKSEFVLLNNYGKIEEISEELYRLLFQKSLRDEVSKVKRLNIFKMLLSLNYFVKNPSEMDERIYEGMITTVETEELLQSYYKLLELGIDKNKKRGSENGATSEDNMSNRSHGQGNTASFAGSGSLGSFTEQRSNSEPGFDPEKCRNDMKEMLKDFFSKVNLSHIRAYKIKYRFYDLVTAEFACKVLEVVSIQEELPSSIVKSEMTREMIEAGELYEMGQDDLNSFRKVVFSDDANGNENLKKSIGRVGSLIGNKIDYGNQQMQTLRDLSEFEQNDKPTQMKEVFDPENTGSVGSLNSDTQKLQKKSTISASFDLKMRINERLEFIFAIMNVFIVLSLGVICFFSTTLEPDYSRLQKDNLIISNFKANFELRLTLQELEHFYHLFNMNPPEFFNKKKSDLTENIKNQLINSIDWIDEQISDEMYFNSIHLTHNKTGFIEQRPIISALKQVYSIFVMRDQQGQHLSDNYETLRTSLDNLAYQQKSVILNNSFEFSNKIHAIVSIYSFVFAILLTVIGLLNHKSKEKEQRIIDFLPFVNIKHILEKISFYQHLIEHFKQNKGLGIGLIQVIEKQSSTQFQQLKRRSQNGRSHKSTKNMGKMTNQGSGNPGKHDSNSRFIRVSQQGQKSNLTFKNCSVGIFLIVVCFAVVIGTEYFFSQAHKKFQAYIQLKESATMVESLAPRTLIVNLINIDRLVNSQPVVDFPAHYTQSPIELLFDLRLQLGKPANFGTELANNLNNHFNQKICNIISCSNNYPPNNTSDIYSLTYRFINALEYTRKIIPEDLPLSPNPKADVQKWIASDNIQQILNGIQSILDLMKKSQQQVNQLFIDQIYLIEYVLLILSLTLIPFLIWSLYFIRSKFIHFVYERLSSIESVYKQFSWEILAENTYALNYFENKLRNSKQY